MILESPSIIHKKMYNKLIKEWGKLESIPTSPSRLFYGDTFEDFLNKVNKDINESDTGINAHLFFLVDNNNIVGAIQIRHSINHPNLIENGGHIGYGIHPNYRKKGYATKILELGLIEANKIGLKDLLITCDIDNIASQKVIKKNGGVFERMTNDGKMNRYLIKL